jgi:DNA-binding GntR family transcriptional regulator
MEKPLCRTVAGQMESRIATGRYAPGELLPPEQELEQEFGVSRITIRQALGLLKRRGLISSRSGVGTVVRARASGRKSMSASGSLQDLIYYAAETRYAPLGRALVKAPAEIAALLEAAAPVTVYCFSGMRGQPRGANFCFETIYVPERLGRNLDNARLGSMTLFNLLEQANNVRIAEVEQIITAVAAPAPIARRLGMHSRAPMLKAVRVYRLRDGSVAEVVVSHYDPAHFEYVMKLVQE